MKIALIQLNSTVGDFKGNLEKFKELALNVPCDHLLVGPELTFSGYQINDMIHRQDFLDEQNSVINELNSWLSSRNQKAIVGRVGINTRLYGKSHENQAVLLDGKNVKIVAVKRLLPTYDVFDENRYFEAGEKSESISLNEHHVGVLICEDGWNTDGSYKVNPVNDLASEGIDFYLSINASPSSLRKNHLRKKIFGGIAKEKQIPYISVNQVGGNDTIVFDGGSYIALPNGEIKQAPFFSEGVLTVDTQSFDTQWLGESVFDKDASIDTDNEQWIGFVKHQLVMGIRDFFYKNGIKRASLALSGGADSSLVLALAVDALGADNITAVTMPSQISSAGSVTDSQALAEMLGVKLYERPIKYDFQAAVEAFKTAFGQEPNRLTMENLQARIRGTSIMAWSNQDNSLVLSTGNKSEVSVGYCTLYGDTNGGLNPIGDLYKTEVYRMLEHYADLGKMPRSVIEKAPSAELFPGQTDQDSLPDYPILDAFLQLYLEGKSMDEESIIKRKKFLKENNFNHEKGMEILKKVELAEFKRKQSCPIIRVRSNTFGLGRNIPIARKTFISENTVSKLLD